MAEIKAIAGSPFEIVIYDHVPFVDPKKYGLDSLSLIDPKDCFVTSGDAVVKSAYLLKSMTAAMTEAKQLIGKSTKRKHKQFLSDLSQAIKAAAKFHELMKFVKGSNIFLEIDWQDRRLIALPKNPRIK